MPRYSFKETISYFAKRLNADLPKELDEEGVDLDLDDLVVSVIPNKVAKGVTIEITLGLLLQPIPQGRLKELVTSNFLGINSGGCTLCLDEEGVTLNLKSVTTAYTPPQESFEWLHRTHNVAVEWMKILDLWEEFIALMPPLRREKQHRVENKA